MQGEHENKNGSLTSKCDGTLKFNGPRAVDKARCYDTPQSDGPHECAKC